MNERHGVRGTGTGKVKIIICTIDAANEWTATLDKPYPIISWQALLMMPPAPVSTNKPFLFKK